MRNNLFHNWTEYYFLCGSLLFGFSVFFLWFLENENLGISSENKINYFKSIIYKPSTGISRSEELITACRNFFTSGQITSISSKLSGN